MDKFNLKFQGEILPGRDPARVKELFAREFNIDNPKRVAAFFSGQKIILRRNLVKDEAAKVFVALRQIGVVTHIEKVQAQEERLPQDRLPQDRLPQDRLPQDRLPQDRLPQDRLPQDRLPQDRLPQDRLPQDRLPQGGLPQKPPPNTDNASSPTAVTPEPSVVRRKRQPGAPNLFDLRHSDNNIREETPRETRAVLSRAPMIAAAIALLAFLLVGVRFWSQAQVETDRGLGLVAVDPRQQPLIQSGDQLLLHDRAGLSTFRLPLVDIDVRAALAVDFFGDGDLVLLKAPQERGLPTWLTGLFRQSAQQGNSLVRCALKQRTCSTLVTGLGPADFLVDRRNNEIYLADAGADQLQKYDASGKLLASKALELNAPLHLKIQEGLVYITQAGSDSVTILKPDERDFGLQLDQVALNADGASQSGHIFPSDLLYVNERWWTVMQSRDANTAGLYLFTPRWKFDREVTLPHGALPSALIQWGNKVLVTDPLQELIYRFDAAAQQERDFSSEFLGASLSERHSQLNLAEILQGFILVMLFGAAAALLALGVLQSMRGKIYTHPHDRADAEFDINNEAIEWLAPAPEVELRLRQLGYATAAGAIFVLLAAFVAQLSTWVLIAITLLLAGLGGLYYALLRASGCHLGLLEDHLILVDHTNTYRVGSGPSIQYFKNYVMIDDVIVYLGNRVLEQFATEALAQKFQPLFTTGIKVDRATLRVKMIQSRHPMLLGVGGLACALFCAAVLVLLS